MEQNGGPRNRITQYSHLIFDKKAKAILWKKVTAAAAKSHQSCLTLCDPTDGNPPGLPVPGILQATTLEWVATAFSNAEKWKVKVKLLSHVQPLDTPWTATYQAPLSMGFFRQEYWSGLPLPSPWKKVSTIIIVTLLRLNKIL